MIVTLKKLYFSEDALSKAEINRIHFQRNKGVALNKEDKSTGAWTSNYILAFIIKCTSVGFTINQIYDALKSLGYKGNLKSLRDIINGNFGSFTKLRQKYYFPVLKELGKSGLSRIQIAELMSNDIIKPFLPRIDYLFRKGYDISKISLQLGLNKFMKSSENAIRSAILTLYYDIYTKSMSFENLRLEVYKDIFLEQIRLGAKDYQSLRERLPGFDRPQYGENIKKRNDYMANLFRKIFNIGIDSVIQDVFPRPSNQELYNEAIKLIRQNSRNTRYSAAQLSIDLGFSTIYGISENTLRLQGSHYIKSLIGVSFKDLKFQALNIPVRNYFELAIQLLRTHIHEIGSSRHYYNMGKLVIDLGLHEDYGFPIDSLKANANRFLNTYTGYYWDDLIKFAISDFLP